MDREPVRSGNVTSIGYEEPSAILEVEFASGAVYQYFDVPAHVYAALMKAEAAGESVGKLLHRQVSKRFNYRRV